jgi:uroporphyrinogen-III synthase
MARLLLTRFEADNRASAKRIVELGHHAVLVPLRDYQPLAPVFPEAMPQAYLATSRHVFDSLAHFPAAHFKIPIYVVGSATAARAAQAGFCKVISAEGNAEQLAGLIEAELPRGAGLHYLAGTPRGPELEARLGRMYRLNTILCYAIAAFDPPPLALKSALEQPLDAVLHFSQESAQAFFDAARSFDLLEAAARLRHACLSEAIAARVRHIVCEPPLLKVDPKIIVAKAPSSDALLIETLAVLSAVEA